MEVKAELYKVSRELCIKWCDDDCCANLNLWTQSRGAGSLASLHSGESNLRDRVLGEVEKNSFISLPGKGGHSGLVL